MGKCALLILLVCLLVGCGIEERETAVVKSYKSDVGYILFDPTVDDSTFKLCDSTLVGSGRSSLIYSDSKSALQEALLSQFKFKPAYEPFSGLVVVRFLANCNKKTGRFRAQSLDFDFSQKECPIDLKKHLMAIVKELENWNHTTRANQDLDYSKYINFKIINGKIERILQ